MSGNKTIVKNSLILYIKLISSSVIGLLTASFILQALGASNFGLYSVVGGIVFMMAFLNNVMISTTYRFVAFEMGRNEPNGINKVLNISMVIHLGLAFLTVLLAETIGLFYIRNYLNVPIDKIADAVFVFRLSILSTVFAIISVPFQGLIVAKEKFLITSSVELLRSVLGLFVVFLVYNYTGNRLRLYAVLIASITIISPILYFFYARHHYSNLIKWRLQKDKTKYKEMVGFSGWIMLGAGASAAEIQVSAILINLFFGTVVNAAFGIANQVKNVVLMFAQSLNQAAIPQITKSFSGGDTDRTMQLVIFTSKYSFYLMLLPALPLLLETKFILQLWLSNVPEYTVTFVQIIIINALIATMNAGIPAIIQATGKIKYFQIFLSTISVLALPSSYILFKMGYEPIVMTLTFTIAAILNLVVLQVLLKYLIKFDIKEFILKAYWKMIIVVIPLLSLFFVKLFITEGFGRFIGLSGLSIISLFILIYVLGMENSEKVLISNQIKQTNMYKHINVVKLRI